jgi:hypothetical protein
MNIFSTKLVNDIAINDVSFLDAGIHENIKLQDIRIDKSPKNGNDYLELTFVNPEGKTLKETIWVPTKFAGQSDAEFEERNKKLMTRLMQILWSYYEKDSLEFTSGSWLDGFTWLKEKLDAKKEDILVRVKVVYGNPNEEGKQYAQLPKYWQYTFIEPMTVEKSRINKLSIDSFERVVKADKEQKTATGFDTFVQKQLATEGINNMKEYAKAQTEMSKSYIPEGLPF